MHSYKVSVSVSLLSSATIYKNEPINGRHIVRIVYKSKRQVSEGKRAFRRKPWRRFGYRVTVSVHLVDHLTASLRDAASINCTWLHIPQDVASRRCVREDEREKGFCAGANEACGQHDRVQGFVAGCAIEISVLSASHDAPTRASSCETAIHVAAWSPAK